MISAVAQATSPARGLLRVTRAGTLACVALGGAIVAHLVADDCLPVPGLVLAAVLLLPGAWAYTARQQSTSGLAVWLLAAQVGLHGVLTGLCGSSPTGAVPPLAVVLGHLAAVGLLAVVMCAADRRSWQRAAVALARLFTPPTAVTCIHGSAAPRPVSGQTSVPASVSRRTPKVLRGPPVTL
ncbi:MAG: hypothetical protein M3N21_04785 [Actinomycetota bacterium]|nr:hypothetical protein [Actinomycetota bacterium]